jgi:hypothetical protein
MTVLSKDPIHGDGARQTFGAGFCPQCGVEPLDGDHFCRGCGRHRDDRGADADTRTFRVTPPSAPETPERVKRLNRPVTLGRLLIALLMTALVFASIAAAMVLTDTGPRGPEGTQGQGGQQGLVGPTGERGVRGRTGKSGAAGLNGAAGTAGTPGTAGARGRPGGTVACSNDPDVPLPFC